MISVIAKYEATPRIAQKGGPSHMLTAWGLVTSERSVNGRMAFVRSSIQRKKAPTACMMGSFKKRRFAFSYTSSDTGSSFKSFLKYFNTGMRTIQLFTSTKTIPNTNAGGQIVLNNSICVGVSWMFAHT